MAIRYNLVISFELHLFGSWITTTVEVNNNVTKPIDKEPGFRLAPKRLLIYWCVSIQSS